MRSLDHPLTLLCQPLSAKLQVIVVSLRCTHRRIEGLEKPQGLHLHIPYNSTGTYPWPPLMMVLRYL